MPSMTNEVVSIRYADLLECHPTEGPPPNSPLLPALARAFGPGTLGVLTVSGVPDYSIHRAKLLPLAHRIGQFPDSILAKYEDPLSLYSFGWSRGRETLATGVVDTKKGSWYNNPLFDVPTTDRYLLSMYPCYCRPNIWPDDDMPELRGAFTSLGKIIHDVGVMLVRACDTYCAQQMREKGLVFQHDRLSASLAASINPKARLLHYYPGTEDNSANIPDDSDPRHAEPPRWCAVHHDHGLITGLTSAMFHDAAGRTLDQSPDPLAGLWIEKTPSQASDVATISASTDNRDVQIRIPSDHIAFQLGQSIEILTAGLLQATPHYVRAATGREMAGVSRSTFAVFLQPSWDDVLEPPTGSEELRKRISKWEPGITFGEFSERTFSGNYN